jgi:hypothetical protein
MLLGKVDYKKLELAQDRLVLVSASTILQNLITKIYLNCRFVS